MRLGSICPLLVSGLSLSLFLCTRWLSRSVAGADSRSVSPMQSSSVVSDSLYWVSSPFRITISFHANPFEKRAARYQLKSSEMIRVGAIIRCVFFNHLNGYSLDASFGQQLAATQRLTATRMKSLCLFSSAVTRVLNVNREAVLPLPCIPRS